MQGRKISEHSNLQIDNSICFVILPQQATYAARMETNHPRNTLLLMRIQTFEESLWNLERWQFGF